MTTILTKLTKMIENRADVARNWHGIKDKETGARFVAADPDVQAYLKANPQVLEALLGECLDVWFDEIAAGVNIAKHREILGDEVVDYVIECSKGPDDQEPMT
jgi:hypothetical protein